MAKQPDQGTGRRGPSMLTVGFCLVGIPVIVGILLRNYSHQASFPEATVINGTYSGYVNDHYSTDHFLGIPYAQPPVGDLRFQVPQSLEKDWTGVRKATEYYASCVGYGDDTVEALQHTSLSEDCLALNVIRPSGTTAKDRLPVLVWIHGGGWIAGGSADQRYNMTFIVEQSKKMGKPIVAVSINYRLSGWGFLWSDELVQNGVANLGFRDQRLALTWVRENIGAFGGDPDKVTIWGESGGSASVAIQMLAYDGRDDGLFSGAISVSGSPLRFGPLNTSPDHARGFYDEVVANVGCSSAPNKLQCLRSVPFEKLDSMFNGAIMNDQSGLSFSPIPDGDIIARPPVDQFLAGSFVRVPYLLGDCSDEGTSVAIFTPVMNSDDDFKKQLTRFGFPPDVLEEIMNRYPQDASWLTPETYHPGNPGSEEGQQWKRFSTVLGDAAFVSTRRFALQSWVNHTDVPIYNFRFDVIPNGYEGLYGASHFVDIPYTFHNLEGTGFTGVAPPWLGPSPFTRKPQGHYDLAELVSRMWVSFTYDGNPNYARQSGPTWQPYTAQTRAQYVFSAEPPSYLTKDNLREEQIAYMMSKIMTKGAPWIN